MANPRGGTARRHRSGRRAGSERRPPVAPPPAAAPPTAPATPLGPSWLWLAAAAAALLVALLLSIFPCRSDDIFMHLAYGRRFLATGRFPDPDPWLFSLPDFRGGWRDVWAAHIAAAVLHRAGGFSLLVLVKAALVVAAAGAPLWLAWRHGRRPAFALALLLVGLWAGSDRFIERTSLVSDVAGAWVLALLADDLLRPGRLRWLLVPLFAAWTQLHPGVLTGLFLVGAAALSRPRDWRRSAPLLAACVAAACLHPAGPRHVTSAVEAVLGGGFDVYRRHYFEFQPTLGELYGETTIARAFVALCVGTAALLAVAARRTAIWAFGLLAAAGLVYLGLGTIRFVTTTSLALPVVAVAVSASPPRWPRLSRALTAAIGLAALALAVKLAGWGYTMPSGSRHLGLGVSRRAHPFAAADFLAGLPVRGGIFNEHAFGSFLAWRWDGRPRIYYHGYVWDPGFYERDYLGVNRSPEEFDRIVAQYDLGAFFLEKQPVTPGSGPLLHRQLLTRPDWKLVYWDDTAMVFLRERPEHRALIETLEVRYFDPFRPDRLAVGLREDPARVLEEAVRVLRHQPDNAPARRVLTQVFQRDPDELLRARP